MTTQRHGYPLECVLPGITVLGTTGTSSNGVDGQSVLEMVSARTATGDQARFVIRTPRMGSVGIDGADDCAGRVVSLFQAPALRHCATVRAVWGVDVDGRVVDLKDITSWHVAEDMAEGVLLSDILADPRPAHDPVTLFFGLGRQLAELHAVPDEDVGGSISRGVHEAVAGPEGPLAIFATYPAGELDTTRDLIEDYLALATRLAWRLEFGAKRPATVCHGDIHPGNVLVNDEGRLTFIDRARLQSREPACDIGIVVANLIRFSFVPVANGTHGATLLAAFFDGYTEIQPEMSIAALGYYVLTCMPSAVSPVFNPTVEPRARWETLRWIQETMTSGTPVTAAEWLSSVTSIQALNDSHTG